MPHAGVHAISARQNKMNKRCTRPPSLVVLAGVRVLLQISAPFTPLSTFRFQPLPAVATHGIDVDITFHYVTSQFSAFGRLGVARRSLALLAGLGVSRRYRCSQVSTSTDLTIARRSRSVGSFGRRWQPQRAAAAGAGGRAMGWTTPPHHSTPNQDIQ
jgi:hypothetical protein